MYLKKSRGESHLTQTYAATGGACAARLLYNTNAHLLDDLEPWATHDQIIDYTHPLDPWGSAMLGVDNGQVCFWGTPGLHAADAAHKYCSRVWGLTGPTLIAAQGGIFIPGGASSSDALNFKRCRYFTHDPEASLLALEQPGVVFANGTTDGGCRPVPVIPQGDTSSSGCPTGRWSADEVTLLVGLVVAIVLAVCCPVVCVCVYCYRRRKRKLKVVDHA